MSRSAKISLAATRRFIYALGLIPIVPGVSVIGSMVYADLVTNLTRPPNLLGRPFDQFRLFQFLFSSLFVAGTLLIWRGFIVWTFGRKVFTGIINLVPFVQVAVAAPLWTMPGCRLGADESVMVGQHQLSVCAWLWLAAWLWWGVERWNMRNGWSSRILGTSEAGSVRRLVACLGMIPAVVGLFLICAVAFEDFTPLKGDRSLISAYWVCAAAAVLIWILIWKGACAWNIRAKGTTVRLTILLLFVPLLLLSFLHQPASPINFMYQAILWALPIIGWGTWMALTVATWPLREAGGGENGPKCPQCGYSLRGLRGTRCPECGHEPTLDELWLGWAAS